jgi:hypothetical protein
LPPLHPSIQEIERAILKVRLEKGEILSQQDLDIYNSPQEAVESDIISLLMIPHDTTHLSRDAWA